MVITMYSHPSWLLMYPYDNVQKGDLYYRQRNPQKQTHGLSQQTDKDKREWGRVERMYLDRPQPDFYPRRARWSPLDERAPSQWYSLLWHSGGMSNRRKRYTDMTRWRTMFSNTIVTPYVSLCTRLMHSVMRDREDSVVVCPTVDPGL